MNGILLIDKPSNWTSRDVVNKLSFILKTKKIGHTGTLDPLATGVLVITVGKYTKLNEALTNTYKEYVAEFILGKTTDTLDITGNVITESDKEVSEEKIEEAIKSFEKTYEQEVPAYSAVKINGKKLYEYARNKERVSLPERKVEIKSIDVLAINNNSVKIKCLVSKGTYIRSLIRDIGAYLGVGATMTSLVRTKQGNFDIDSCYSINDIEKQEFKMLNIEQVLDVKIIELNDKLYKLVDNGVKINLNYENEYILFKLNNKEFALYKKEEDYYKMFIKL